jgi:hypothetical protein
MSVKPRAVERRVVFMVDIISNLYTKIGAGGNFLNYFADRATTSRSRYIASGASHRHQRATHGLLIRMRPEFTPLLAEG